MVHVFSHQLELHRAPLARITSLGILARGRSKSRMKRLNADRHPCHAWRPFKHIYLMSPNNETTRKGEYGVLDDVTCLDHWPTLDYWESRPGRSALIVDDISWSLSKRGSPSQYELADRTCGHVSSHLDTSCP